ncbi:MAG TPA: hypothetical protein PKC70_13125 [Cellvibrionaceae bacterium]|nr:hypothetical protein [Cellvibrionaceae bacterium]
MYKKRCQFERLLAGQKNFLQEIFPALKIRLFFWLFIRFALIAGQPNNVARLGFT